MKADHLVYVLWALACGGGVPDSALRIECVGNSITYGFTRGSTPGQPPAIDLDGGYPGRLGRRLGRRAQVIGRGIGGADTLIWASPLRAARGIPDGIHGFRIWDMVRKTAWTDFDAEDLDPDAPSVLVAVLARDHPDLVILLLGVNDLVPWLRDPDPDPVEGVADRLLQLRRQAESLVDTVLVATVLPNERDSPEVLARLNARIRADHPDFLPLEEAFAAHEWHSLLGDRIHPNGRGYELLAEVLERELVLRDLVPPKRSR